MRSELSVVWSQDVRLGRRDSTPTWYSLWWRRSPTGWGWSVGLIVIGVSLAARLPSWLTFGGLAILNLSLLVEFVGWARSRRTRGDPPVEHGDSAVYQDTSGVT
jgi:hypothetical protein